MEIPTIAIIGGGLSGSLLALNLLHRRPTDLRILLIERHGGFGRGLAYSTHRQEHLLNVRVGNMSAFEDQPDHAAVWLARRSGGHTPNPVGFITREAYGEYLAAMIRREVEGADTVDRLILAHDEAVSLKVATGGVSVELAMGLRHRVDLVVLATGNAPPAPPAEVGLQDLAAGAYVENPWSPDALAGLAPFARVVLLGTGLTMVDAAVSLNAQGHTGPILALSRRGRVPHAHDLAPPCRPEGALPTDERLSELLFWARRRAREIGWRRVVDDLRPFTQNLWRRADLATRRRFLRHLRPWWDVHRHRMAPRIAAGIGDMRASGQLRVMAGRMLKVAPTESGVAVTWRPRGGADAQAFDAERIINCTGPGSGPALSRDRLIGDLLAQGMARIDPLELGLEVDDDCRLVRRDGTIEPSVYAIGPLTRGALWEVVAAPDIRTQAAGLADRIAAQLTARYSPAAARQEASRWSPATVS